jgi:hypothetical protein
LVHDRFREAVPGRAFDGTASSGAAVPIHLDTSLVVASVILRNRTAGPIRLLGIEPAWESRTGQAMHFRINAPGMGSSGVAVGLEEPGAAPVPHTVVQPGRTDADGRLVSFDLRLAPDGGSSLVVGIDVFYEQGGRPKRQTIPLTVLACPWGPDIVPPRCEDYQGVAVTKLEFDDLLRVVRKLA